jgi:hypothetical protein
LALVKGDYIMNKDEILAKSRKENKDGDEREIRILANASKIGMAVGGILAVIIVLFSRMVNEPLLGLSAWAVYFAMFGSRRLYQFIQTKEKIKLVQAIIGIVYGLACFIGMIVLGLQ